MSTGSRAIALAVDIGTVRVGVARSDASGTLAVPERTVARTQDWIGQIRELIAEYEVLEIIFGVPTGLSGEAGAAATAARQAAGELAAAVAPVGVRLIDERFTSVIAGNQLREAGISTRKGRGLVDQAAAVIMLQNALDTERATGVPPGTLLIGPQ